MANRSTLPKSCRGSDILWVESFYFLSRKPLLSSSLDQYQPPPPPILLIAMGLTALYRLGIQMTECLKSLLQYPGLEYNLGAADTLQQP